MSLSCKKCECKLVPGENWPISRQNKRSYICSPCHSAATREWEKTNPERHREGNNRRNRKLDQTQERRVYYRERARAIRDADGVRARYRDLEGDVYIVSNPQWPGHVKIGHARDAKRRLRQFDTGSPFRDYVLEGFVRVVDRLLAERIIHHSLAGHRVANTEWFRVHPDDARKAIAYAVTKGLVEPAPENKVRHRATNVR